MEDVLNALFAAIPAQGLILFAAIDEEDIIIPQDGRFIPEEEIVFPQDGRLMHLRDLGLPVERVFEPVLQYPDKYLKPRYAPFEELPAKWEAFSGNNYLGVQQHLQEELDAPKEVEDMDNEQEEFPENDGLGVQQHLPEALEAPEQVEDMDNEEEDFPQNDDLGVQQHFPEELETPEQVEDMHNEEEEIPENDDLGVQQHLPEALEAPEQVEDMHNEEEEFPENDDLGVQQHLPEALEAPEQVEDMDNEEEDLGDHEETMNCTKTSSEDVDVVSSASQPVAKRVDVATSDLMLKAIGSSSSSVSTFGLQESTMPDASPPAFGPIREPVTTSEVQTPNI